jgi:DNA-binding response OmpR family regulator
MQVLLVEDSPVYRKLVGTHLENWGFKMVIAQDGSDAWRLLQHAECPKLVLLDWVLPGMDGIDICRKIRQAKGPQYFYVIILTGKDARKDLLEAPVLRVPYSIFLGRAGNRNDLERYNRLRGDNCLRTAAQSHA